MHSVLESGEILNDNSPQRPASSARDIKLKQNEELGLSVNSGQSNANILRAGTLGAMGATALGVAMMAPALGIYANLGPVSAGVGKASPSVFVIALFLTIPTAISYALLSREVP